MRKTSLFAAGAILAVVAGGNASAYEAIAVTDGGTISGTIKASGAPAAAKLEVTKDQEVCGKEKTDPQIVVGPNGGLANALVVVKATKGKKLELPAKNPVFDQKMCEFHPHVLLFPAGSTIDVLNSDGILHNLHTTSTVNPPTNTAQPKFKPKINIKIEKPEWPISVKCDVHGWMSAIWVAQEHPYYAATDANGAFKIADLPAGDYDVELWHEKLGKKMEKVSVKANEETKVDWTLGK